MGNRLESIAVVVGGLLVTLGAAGYSWQVAMIVGGALLILLAIWPARPAAR